LRRGIATIAAESRNLGELHQVVAALRRPFNIVTGWLHPGIAADPAAQAGAKWFGVGGVLSRLALAGFASAGCATREQRSFAWMRDMMPIADTRRLFATGAPQ